MILVFGTIVCFVRCVYCIYSCLGNLDAIKPRAFLGTHDILMNDSKASHN